MPTRICIVLFIGAAFCGAVSAQIASEPSLISAPKPVYPPEAKDAGIGGTISVEITIDEAGQVVKVGDVTGPAALCGGSKNDPRVLALRSSAAEAMKQAKFYPGVKDGKPVKTTVWANQTFDPSEGLDPNSPKKVVSVGMVTGKAIRMPKPEYPGAARAVRASGAVAVRVVVDEKGDVFTAEAVSGHPLLRPAAVEVACEAKFSPTEIGGKLVRIAGVIVYNFFPGRPR